jgi:hypothetical protein
MTVPDREITFPNGKLLFLIRKSIFLVRKSLFRIGPSQIKRRIAPEGIEPPTNGLGNLKSEEDKPK